MSGNAVYVRYTRQDANLAEDDPTLHRHIGGLLIAGNEFIENSSIVHSSHGGAISIEVDDYKVEERQKVTRGDVEPVKLTSEFQWHKHAQMLYEVSEGSYYDFKQIEI